MTDICRKPSVSQATFICGNSSQVSGVEELRELRQLRDENSRLKHVVADLSFDPQILQEIASKSCETSPALPAGEVSTGAYRIDAEGHDW